MNFEDAVRKAAEMKPESFEIIDYKINPFVFITGRNGFYLHRPSQDDIDSLAAVFGKTLWAEPSWDREYSGAMLWRGYYLTGRDRECDSTGEKFPTKLEAAKAAFIAIIAQDKQEER